MPTVLITSNEPTLGFTSRPRSLVKISASSTAETGVVRSEVDPTSDRARVVDRHREALGDIVKVDVRPPDGGGPEGHHPTLLEPPEEESPTATAEERAGTQSHERDAAPLQIVLDEFLLPEMGNVTGLIAGQDAREDESTDPRLLRGVDEVPVPEVVHFFQRVALSAARVSRCAGDDSIRAAHGSLQRRRVEHVPSRDFHTFRRETARVRSLADERADAFPALQERVHHSTSEVPRGTYDQDGVGFGHETRNLAKGKLEAGTC